MKKLRHWIPLGTLVVLLSCWAVAHWRTPPGVRPRIEPAPAGDVKALEFPERRGVVDGRVVDAQEQGIGSALIWLQTGEELSFLETAADGSFHFDAVSAGVRTFGVLAHGFRPQRFSVEDDRKSAHLVLAERLAAPPVLPELRRSRLAGRVAAGASALAGAQVCLAPRDPPETFGAPVPVRASCDENGRFVFENLIEGDYTVSVLPAWAADGSWPDLLRPAAQARANELHHPGANGASEIELASLAGSIGGFAREASGAPVEAALIVVAPLGQSAHIWPPASSGPDGRFECTDLPPGRYVVTVSAGSDSHEVEVDVQPGALAEIEIDPLDVSKAR